MQKQILHKDYTSYGGTFQPNLPLNFEFQIKKDDPVRLLLHCIHQMDLTPLYRSFRRAERNLVLPHQLLAILIYAYMNQIYSSRRIEEVCLRDIHFMYLLEGRPAPDHTTIARFRREHFAPAPRRFWHKWHSFLHPPALSHLRTSLSTAQRSKPLRESTLSFGKKALQRTASNSWRNSTPLSRAQKKSSASTCAVALKSASTI